MADNGRPRGRERHVSGVGSGGDIRGEGLGTGPVGSGGHMPGGSGGGPQRSGGGGRRGGGGGLIFLIMVVLMLLGGGGGLLLGGGSSGGGEDAYPSSGSGTGSGSISDYYDGSGSYSYGWDNGDASHTSLDTTVAEGSRLKYTTLRGGGKDTVTIMVYMCGTDLESGSGMATSDLQEMAAAKLSDKVNLLVYTGGCARWRNNVVSSRTNQIYQVTGGGLKPLVKDDGSDSMTNPDTLSRYIRWAASKYPADRYALILWDHGGGSAGGFGYDEKNKNSGSMSLSDIGKALEKGGVKFDFIGFDACLMATLENALMLDKYGDYLIGSEETEPGVGWYYTDWLNALSANTSMPTIEIGQKIADTFVEACAVKCRGQQTTLSVVDLAELHTTVPDKLNKFSKSISTLLSGEDYASVSKARNNTREFATSARIDQVDLVDLASNIGNTEGRELIEAVRGAVKYNRTSTNMTNAYGLSIYFPYRASAKYVDSVSDTYDQIGMDADYTACIREFASMEVCGMAGSGGSGSPYDSLFGDYAGEFSGLDSTGSDQLIGLLLGSFLRGDYSRVSGLDASNASFVSDRPLSDEQMKKYVQDHHLDPNQLGWVREDGKDKIVLSEDQWRLVTGIDENLYLDNGSGYIDLGLDNVFSFDDKGSMIADSGRAWLAINSEAVPYYHETTVDDGKNYTITGRVPCLISGQLSNLIIVFDNDHPEGYVAGACADYGKEDGVNVAAKNITDLQEGDTIDYVCDFYGYDGSYQDSYKKGAQVTIKDPDNLDEELKVSDIQFYDSERTVMTYKFTDIFGRDYWTEALKK